MAQRSCQAERCLPFYGILARPPPDIHLLFHVLFSVYVLVLERERENGEGVYFVLFLVTVYVYFCRQ